MDQNRRPAYKIDTSNPGSDLAGEVSAAMAASSIAFRMTGTQNLFLSETESQFFQCFFPPSRK